MSDTMRVYCPAARPSEHTEPSGRALASLRGKTVGFIDNAKPNFEFLVDDLEAQLVSRWGVKAVRKHRKPGQVPVNRDALAQLAAECDAVITGSGD